MTYNPYKYDIDFIQTAVNPIFEKEVRGNMKTPHPTEEKFLQKFKKLSEDRKSEVIDFIDFLSRKKQSPASEGDGYEANLEALRLKIREKGGIITGRSKEQVIKKLRATRETLYKEDYADRFGQ